MRILREECTGLIVDIQERLYPAISGKEELLSKCIRMIEGLKILNIPTLFTQQYTRGLGPTLPAISTLVSPFTCIEKRSFSCLDEPAFAELLETTGRKNVLILGIEAHVCILQTAVDLQERGYCPVVISDCISSRSSEEKATAINRFLQEGIRVSTTESILFELTRSSDAAEFKAISMLIK